MRIGITGAHGFVGRHLAKALEQAGHEVVRIVSRPVKCHRIKTGQRGADEGLRGGQRGSADQAGDGTIWPIGLDDPDELTRAFSGCRAVAHCAGINRQSGGRTWQRVHVQGTANVVAAAEAAGVTRIALVSFLRARPHCGSGYHESKWAAEQIVRQSALDHTILKCGVIYGRGDHMLDHLSHALHTFPVFGLVGMRDQPVRPVAIADVVKIMRASLVDGRLSNKTVAVMGPEQMMLGEAVRRVAHVVRKQPIFVRLPLWFHYPFAWLMERTMRVPMVSVAQVRILSEGIVEALPGCDKLDDDLKPALAFTEARIRAGLPQAGPFTWRDCRCLNRLAGQGG